MSAVYCGSKRSYFDDTPSPPPSSKRFRCYSPSNSPSWSSSPSSSIDQLRTAFPHLELTVLVKALEDHGSDLNAAMKSLYALVSAEEERAAANKQTDAVAGGGTFNASPASADDWVSLLVREVTQSSGTDDAKVRAERVLEALEKTLSARAHEEAGKKFQEESVAVQQQVEVLIKDNTVLKRAVAIQHERQKALEDANQQLEFLKQLIPQYQEKVRHLEVNNYALKLQLEQMEHGNSMMPQRFNPDVF